MYTIISRTKGRIVYNFLLKKNSFRNKKKQNTVDGEFNDVLAYDMGTILFLN